MKIALAAGVALAGLALSAFAEDRPPSPDANGDGWITRAEASASADRMFAELDASHDGKLDEADRAADHGMFHHHHMIERRGDGTLEHSAPPAPPNTPLNAPGAPGTPPAGDDDHHGGPHFGHPPMMMMFFSHEEADLNHDGALSQEEFRNLHLRFFDAADVNGDGRIKFDPPHFDHDRDAPDAPQPPAPPR